MVANRSPQSCDADAIKLARTAVDDGLPGRYPGTLIRISRTEVGLRDAGMSNNEVGQQNIAVGRSVEQDVMHITARIHHGTPQL